MFKYRNLIVVALTLFITASMVKISFSAEGTSNEDPAGVSVGTLTADMSKQIEEGEGMNQGDFAIFLVQALGAQGFLPTAATTQDYFDFLEKIGVVPLKGWDANGAVKKEELCYMCNAGAQDCEQATIGELLEKLKRFLGDRTRRGGLANYNSEGTAPPISP